MPDRDECRFHAEHLPNAVGCQHLGFVSSGMRLNESAEPPALFITRDWACLHLEDESRLQLEHARRVDICERRDRVRGRADGNQLPERRERRARVAVDRLSASQVVPVI